MSYLLIFILQVRDRLRSVFVVVMVFTTSALKQMHVPFIFPAAGIHVVAIGAGSALLGAIVDGLGGAEGGAIAGVVVAIVVETIRSIIVLRKQRVDNVMLIDDRRDKLEERDAQLHAKEIAFMQIQVDRAQKLELVSRKRVHALSNEVQRCMLYIRVCQERLKAGVAVDPFKERTLEEIVEPYPLPPIDSEEFPT